MTPSDPISDDERLAMAREVIPELFAGVAENDHGHVVKSVLTGGSIAAKILDAAVRYKTGWARAAESASTMLRLAYKSADAATARAEQAERELAEVSQHLAISREEFGTAVLARDAEREAHAATKVELSQMQHMQRVEWHAIDKACDLARDLRAATARAEQAERERDALREAAIAVLVDGGPCDWSESDPPSMCDRADCSYCALNRMLSPAMATKGGGRT